MRVLDVICEAAPFPAEASINEDRTGATADAAFVIDGATDVLAKRLTRADTDAAWFAQNLIEALPRHLSRAPLDLFDIVAPVADEMARRLEAVQVREPASPAEHPSAAGIIVRRRERALDLMAIGDCSAVLPPAEPGGPVRRFGVEEADAGDTWYAAALAKLQASEPEASGVENRARLVPRLRAGRAAMNLDDGYGVFSITPTPRHLVKLMRAEIAPGAPMLIASDGLMRLVDVFKTLPADALLARAAADGLARLVQELRALERADPDCRSAPRAKIHDDVAAMLVLPLEPAR